MKVKKLIITVISVILILAIIPISVFFADLIVPSQFDETYYGELGYMYDRLKGTKGRKIVFVGNSAVAFGIRPDLIEKEIEGYSVVNFGLYGAIGTKTMLDLSAGCISKGDIIVVMPEPVEQSMSLYFSPSEYWRSADSSSSLKSALLYKEGEALFANYPSYVAEKVSYYSSGGLTSSGVYSQSSFNSGSSECGYMTYDREYNEMYGGYDLTGMLDFDSAIIGSGFIDYLNDYAKSAQKKGAEVYFGFVPANALSIVDEGKIDDYCNYLKSNLNFPLLGHQSRYVMDYEWFYDNNVHMNTSGMINYTYLLCEDLKILLSDSSGVNFRVPEKPEIPVKEIDDGNNSDANCFTYEEKDGSVTLTGLTDEGKGRTSIVLPTKIDGLPVERFLPSVFAGNTTISEIYLPSSIKVIEDYSFDGCTRLTKIIIEHNTLNGLTAGSKFLDGADKCFVYVNAEIYNGLVNGCGGGWEVYKSRLKPI
jgi:hypothetical protein